jgi:NAD(P)-dependent dehydrogenase (short-subunit alcohol dehydrogenase family)
MIALVAGASRGCGRGIAVALGDVGATVYVTGRGTPPVDGASGTLEQTALEVNRRGGIGIPVRVDHTNAESVRALFSRIKAEAGALDVFVSAVWGGNERFLDPVWNRPFWEHPAGTWSEFMDAGPRAFWLGAREAAALMAPVGSGLIVAISEPVTSQFEGQFPRMSETFGQLAHGAINQLIPGMSVDASEKGITVLGLLPGFMRTERVEMHLPDEKSRELFRYDLSETPEYTGRAVAALAADPNILSKSGKLHYVADLAGEYDFNDTDGKRPGNFYKIALGYNY